MSPTATRPAAQAWRLNAETFIGVLRFPDSSGAYSDFSELRNPGRAMQSDSIDGRAERCGAALRGCPRRTREAAMQAIQLEIDDGRGVEGQKLTQQQPADDGDPERETQL